MRVLIACEESQTVCKAFRERGHEAYSCDILPCSGGHPEWHIQDDVLKHLDDGWDMMIAHPPCTYLSYAGNDYFNVDKYGETAMLRHKLRLDGFNFFTQLYFANIDKIAVENPKGYPMQYMRFSQLIEPYYFGDSAKKSTLLWLKNLPLLKYTLIDNLFETKTGVDKPKPIYGDKISGKKRYITDAISGKCKDSSTLRSKTFPGIAKAMAEQWG